MSATAAPVETAIPPLNIIVQRQVFDAAASGDSHAIRLLALQGADLQARDADGFTPFAVATRNNHADTAMTILSAIEAQYMRSFSDDVPASENGSDGALKKVS